MKTIMLCLNKLDIGGIETAVLNQTINLINLGYRIIVLSADGIYREKFEKEGAIFFDMHYSIKDTNVHEKIAKVEQIIDNYSVCQVHIHQFECINIAFFACILKKVPYVAYLHNSISGTYDWYEQANPAYKELFKLFFKCSEKIVAIQKKSKQENQNKYKLPDDKYIIIKNSINFEKFKINENHIPKKIEKFLIISRFSSEKENSIYNAINLFKDYYKQNSNARLTIVGDGMLKENIEKKIENIKSVTTMLGARNDIAHIISQNDIVVSLDRCILEAITMKKLAIISGYDSMKELITSDNIEKASNNNFNGDNLLNKNNDELIKQLNNLKLSKIQKIVEENYKYAYDNLNANTNFYIIEDENNNQNILDNSELIKSIINMYEDTSKNISYTDKVYKDCKNAQKWFEQQILIRDKEINDLKFEKNENIKKLAIANTKINELNTIYNTRFYKIYKKLSRLKNNNI